ncbi:hypothetical protein AVEN_177568-1 [Araneus ventricosus]|uniref:Uncharacterized protein n=1 Tax=Araneus ventricosus TaxID=182803 RepID=A0A4Y2E3K8_ARAVE|nr:hypothetical protein AVEN_177568-1 [Araneus ventricosus]
MKRTLLRLLNFIIRLNTALLYLIRWQESIRLNPLPNDGGHKFFFNIHDLVALNACVIYKEVVGTKIKRRNYILNLADELRNNYVSSKTSMSSDFTPGSIFANPTLIELRQEIGQYNWLASPRADDVVLCSRTEIITKQAIECGL